MFLSKKIESSVVPFMYQLLPKPDSNEVKATKAVI